MNIKKYYEDGKYKKLFLIPIITLIISIYFIFQMQFGIDLAGGTRITVVTDGETNIQALESNLNSEFNLKDLTVRQTSGLNSRVYVEFADAEKLLEAEETLSEIEYQKFRENYKNEIIGSLVAFLNVPEENISFQEVGPSTGQLFWEQARNALILAFVLITILVFIFFRKLVVSLSVIQAALFDIIVGLGAIGFLGIPLSLTSIAPLLMLIGYSVDTDIMLADRVMSRKKGSVIERISDAFETGITITGTTIGAMTAMLIISYLTNMEVLFNISLIMIVGLAGDLISTWCTNAGLLIWNQEK